MRSLRAFTRDHRGLTAFLIALALAMKALVPAGYMLSESNAVLTVQICADAQGQHLTKQIAIPMSGKAAGGETKHGAAGGGCAFGSLAMALSGTDGILLALALVFVLVLGFAPGHPPRLRRIARSLPPLRGPPLSA